MDHQWRAAPGHIQGNICPRCSTPPSPPPPASLSLLPNSGHCTGGEAIRLVGCSQDDDTRVAGETIHLSQKLINGLLPLIIPTAHPCTSLPPNSINLINENDARRLALRLLKQIPNPRSPNPNEQLQKLRRRAREERCSCLPCKSATALASSVFPVPGGPTRRHPLAQASPDRLLQHPRTSLPLFKAGKFAQLQISRVASGGGSSSSPLHQKSPVSSILLF